MSRRKPWPSRRRSFTTRPGTRSSSRSCKRSSEGCSEREKRPGDAREKGFSLHESGGSILRPIPPDRLRKARNGIRRIRCTHLSRHCTSIPRGIRREGRASRTSCPPRLEPDDAVLPISLDLAVLEQEEKGVLHLIARVIVIGKARLERVAARLSIRLLQPVDF